MAIKDTHGGHHGRGTLPNVMDVGAVGCGYLEADITQRINKLIIKYAKCPDTTDRKASSVNQNLANIVTNMNKYAGDYHISNHLNAFNGTANGVEVWYYAGDSKAKEMATKVSAAIAKATGMFNRGAKATTNLYVIRNSVGRTLLIEWGFIDNKSDVKKLLDNMDKAVQEVVKLFGYSVGTATTTVTPPKTEVKPATSGLAKNTKPLTDGKVGDTVKVYDALYADSTGAGRSTAKRGSSGKIKKIVGNSKKYLIENWGWAHANDIQLVKRATDSTPLTPAKPEAREYAESGIFTITSGPIALRLGNTPNSKLVSWLVNGQSVKYDRVKLDVDGHVWVRQTPKRKEGYAWIATGKTNANAQRGSNPKWGTFK